MTPFLYLKAFAGVCADLSQHSLAQRCSFRLRHLAAAAAFVIASASSAYADTVTATWNANPEPDVTCYILSYGTVSGGPYPNVVGGGCLAGTSRQVTLTNGFTYYFVVQARNTAGLTSPNSAQASINLTNLPPTLTAVPNQTHLEGASPSLQLVASDPNSNPLTYGASGLPPGLSVNTATGLISGTLGYTASGTYNATATVTDGIALPVSRTFTWTVVNRAPAVTIGNDFDGDLKSDVGLLRSTGMWSIWRSGSNNTLTYEVQAGTTGDIPVAGDYDGDARTDVGYFRPSNGSWNIRTSSSNYASSVTYSLGGAPDRPAPGDYDGDGKTDPTVFHPSTGVFEVLTSSSNFVTRTNITHGAATDRPLSGDFDGDGKSDAAVFKTSGQWSIRRSSNSTTLNVTPGSGTDVPAPGDYDGDGKTDAAAYRPSTGVWNILRSSTNFTGAPLVINGLSGQVVAPGDYDGDRKTDAVTFNPSNGQWNILTSVSNFLNTLSVPLTSGTPDDWPMAGLPFYTRINHAPTLTNPGGQPNGTSEQYAQVVLADSPTAYWRFGDASGTVAADRIGANPGALAGGVALAQAGVFTDNTAVGFSGADGTRVTVANSASLAAIHGSSAVALEAWVNPQALTVPSHYQIFYSFPDQAASYLALYDNGGVLRPLVSLVINGTQRSFVAGPALSVGNWYHIAATYDGATLTLYVDGTAVGQLTGLSGGVSTGTSGIHIGGYALGGGFGLNGLVDEPAIYNHTLSAARVATHYAQRTYAHAVSADGPVSYWRLSDSSGTSAVDQTGTNPGTVSGGVTLGQPGALGDGNTAMLFDGIDGTGVSVANSPSLAGINTASAVTMEAWINARSLTMPSGFRLFYGFPGQLATYLGLYNNGSGAKVVVSMVIGGVQKSFVAGPTVAADTWYHVVATYDGATLTLYMNGAAVGQVAGLSGLVGIGSSGMRIGSYPSAGTFGFDGRVDEAAIYARALSAGQIATHYALRTLPPNRTISMQLTGSDSDGDTITYSASGLPSGLSISATTGLISGTLTAAPGSYAVTITASDGMFATSQTFTWVIPNNRAPVVTNPGDQPSGSSEPYAQAVLADTPAAYWRFGEPAGVNAADQLRGNHGLVPGSVTLGQAGIFTDNSAMAFRGEDGSKVTVPNSPSLLAIDGGTSLALEAWVKPQTMTVPSHYQIFYSFPGQAASYLGLYDSGNVLRPLVALVINGTQRSFVAGPALAIGSWYHVVVTYNGSALRLYVDGTEVGQLTGLSGPVSIGAGGVQLGGYPIAGGYNLNGLVDEPAIYDHSLTATQVAAHYAQRTYSQAVLADSPVAFWRLGETGGTTAADRAGSNNATISGSVTLNQSGALADGNKAMRFDGVDGTDVIAPNSASLMGINGSAAVSMEAWVNPQSLTLPSGYRLFYSFPGQPGTYIGLYNGGGTPRFVVSMVINGVQRSFVGGPTVVAGSWYHVAATYDGAAMTLYINGAAVGQLAGLSGPLSLGASGVQLGSYPVAGASLGFDGFVDEAAIYAYALPAGQVAMRYALRTLVPSNTVALQIVASDPDADTMTFSASGLPAGLSINSATGLISGTLSAASVGTHSVTVTAADASTSSSQSFTWVVTNP